ncbi:MAG: formate dehydrogenase accessory sulfurtransferase FdhD [Lachnospiraceae bacterium]|nr:formate dehydrogenase accessory sulfurtransferase FdhD [Lachnospiraceae bacterium]
MKDNVAEIPVLKVTSDGERIRTTKNIIREHLIEVCAEGRILRTIVCTDTDIKELVYGFLFSEDYIESASDVTEFYMSDKRDRARVAIKDDKTAASGRRCEGPVHFTAEQIFKLTAYFKDNKGLHSKTDGTHVCMLMHKDEIVFITEDISRHNMLDKAIGYALLNDIPMRECLLFTSGRVPKDVADKMTKAGLGVLVSKAVPTDASVKAAKEAGLKLVCWAWPDSFIVINGEDDAGQIRTGD